MFVLSLAWFALKFMFCSFIETNERVSTMTMKNLLLSPLFMSTQHLESVKHTADPSNSFLRQKTQYATWACSHLEESADRIYQQKFQKHVRKLTVYIEYIPSIEHIPQKILVVFVGRLCSVLWTPNHKQEGDQKLIRSIHVQVGRPIVWQGRLVQSQGVTK